MTVSRVTQQPVEVLGQADSASRVTQLPVEVLGQATSNARTTQLVIEVLANEPDFDDAGSLGTGSEKTAQSSFNFSTGLAVSSGQLVVVVVATDNEGGASGELNEHTSVTIDGNAMTKALENTLSSGLSDDGSTVSVWYWLATTDVDAAVAVVTTLSTGRTAKAATGRVFDIADGYEVSVDGTAADGQTLADLPSVTANGNETDYHIWVRGSGLEDDSANPTFTATNGWTAWESDGTTGNPATSNQTVYAESRISLSSSSGASDPSSGVTVDNSSVVVGLLVTESSAADDASSLIRMLP